MRSLGLLRRRSVLTVILRLSFFVAGCGALHAGSNNRSDTAWMVSMSNVAFGNQVVNTTSAAKTVRLRNPRGSSLKITISASGDFAQTNNCPARLGARGSCTIAVTFTPTAEGTRKGALRVKGNATASEDTSISIYGDPTPFTAKTSSPTALVHRRGWRDPALLGPWHMDLSGRGVSAPAPAASLSARSLNFGKAAVKATSAPQMVTLSNPRNVSLRFKGITSSGDFAQTNNCPASLLAGGNCTVTVTFTPTGVGTRYGALSVMSNAAGRPQQVSLRGMGISTPAPAPGVSLSPPSLRFGDQAVNTGGGPLTAVLSNPGNGTLNINSISASGDFAQGNNCPASLLAGGNCTVTVTFTPTRVGTRTGALSVMSNAMGRPQQVSLSGMGISTPAPAPGVSLSPPSLTFGDQVVNTSGSPLTVVLSNRGNATLNISGISASGDFGQGNNCPASIGAGGKCTIALTFSPTIAGQRNGAVSVTYNATGSPQQVSLSGTGLRAPSSAASLSPSRLIFGNQALNTTSTPQTITLTNSGNTTLNISGIAANGDFAQTNNCPASLVAGGKCTITVTFRPTVVAVPIGAVIVTDDTQGSPQQVTLNGTGFAPVQHSVDLSWDASTSSVIGYNIYRGAQSGGPYMKINPTLEASTSYTDVTVKSGQTYFYVETAIDTSNKESGFSTEVSATLPAP